MTAKGASGIRRRRLWCSALIMPRTKTIPSQSKGNSDMGIDNPSPFATARWKAMPYVATPTITSEHRQHAKQAEAREYERPVQAHADGVADDPSPPATPVFGDRVAFLRIDHTPRILTHSVALTDKRPSQVQVLDLSPV
jgi:hypothetical protein